MIRKSTILLLVVFGPTAFLVGYNALDFRRMPSPIPFFCALAPVIFLEIVGLSVLLRGQVRNRRKLKMFSLAASIIVFLIWQVSPVFRLGYCRSPVCISIFGGSLWIEFERTISKWPDGLGYRAYTQSSRLFSTGAWLYGPTFCGWDCMNWWPHVGPKRYLISMTTSRILVGQHIILPLWPAYLAIVAWTVFVFWRYRGFPPGCCQVCSYDLTGNVSGICPECGTEVKRP